MQGKTRRPGVQDSCVHSTATCRTRVRRFLLMLQELGSLLFPQPSQVSLPRRLGENSVAKENRTEESEALKESMRLLGTIDIAPEAVTSWKNYYGIKNQIRPGKPFGKEILSQTSPQASFSVFNRHPLPHCSPQLAPHLFPPYSLIKFFPAAPSLIKNPCSTVSCAAYQEESRVCAELLLFRLFPPSSCLFFSFLAPEPFHDVSRSRG